MRYSGPDQLFAFVNMNASRLAYMLVHKNTDLYTTWQKATMPASDQLTLWLMWPPLPSKPGRLSQCCMLNVVCCPGRAICRSSRSFYRLLALLGNLVRNIVLAVVQCEHPGRHAH